MKKGRFACDKPPPFGHLSGNYYISSKKAKFETIFVRGKECLIHPDAVLLA